MFSPAPSNKQTIRSKIWTSLLPHALPDSRFNLDFSSFIPDFQGSPLATERLVALPCYKAAQVVFITPDNCLEGLRLHALRAGKKVLVTTYAIRRGFVLLEPDVIERGGGRFEVAAMLDGMEKPEIGRYVSLAELRAEGVKVGLCVTGTGAVSMRGVRFGKGHGFFDLEWGMLRRVGVVEGKTVVVAVVHGCQIVDEAGEGMGLGLGEMRPEEWDTVCDFIVTPERVVEVEGVVKPDCGILWERLEEGMLESIPPLRELRELEMGEL
ncbi:nagb/rpia/CoA transferase-like protein [Lepidopterella palustris CBS 459.81]|uniref:Nagb/rpia/CoA transferase-like protein n=1 Tax=Lepidopterella palustris CBS 459.81 TaxID=1314670 RepID=A0A8E2JC45_9PEZI|nr:nagb/rpia/CoA transferase-like protein [Lepidopterella palustris CBS 459.81]